MSEIQNYTDIDAAPRNDPFEPTVPLGKMLFDEVPASLLESASGPSWGDDAPVELPRAMRRRVNAMNQQKERYLGMVSAGQALLAHEPDDTARAIKLQMIAKETNLVIQPEFGKMLVYGASRNSITFKGIQDAEEYIFPVVLEHLEDPEWRYELLKSLASASFKSGTPTEDSVDEYALIAFYRSSFRGSTPDSPTLIEYFDAQLQDGQYDHYMVRDVICAEFKRGESSHITQLADYTRAVKSELSEEELRDVLSDNYMSWPDFIKKTVDSQIQGYKEMVQKSLRTGKKDVHDLCFDRTQDELYEEFKALLVESVHAAPDTMKPGISSTRKKRGKVRTVKREITPPTVEDEDTVSTLVSTRVYSIKQGDYTDTPISKLIESTANANDATFKDGLGTMIEYVSTNIHNPQINNGIKSLRASRLGPNVYEFKPLEAKGFSSKHRQLKATRFIFKLLEYEGNTKIIAPIAFVARAELDRWIANQS